MSLVRTVLVRLTPRASHNRVGESTMLLTGEEQLSVYVTAPPEDGKANAAMLKLLAETWKIAPSRITILRGLTARTKLLRVE